MAGKPTKRRGKYYSRVNIKLEPKKYKQIWYPLKTTNKRIADQRWFEVKKYESQIKLYGRGFKLSWLTDDGRVSITRYTVIDAIDDYIKYKKAERLENSTIERIGAALSHLRNVVGGDKSLSDVKIEQIDMFKQYSLSIPHKPNTLNNNLSKIKALLTWAYDRGKIEEVPIIKMVKVDKSNPKYITDIEWLKILKLDKVYRKHCGYDETLEEHWKRAFYFYRETGCRLSEPFKGKLNGNWLIIDPNDSKTKVARVIFIPDELLDILIEMKARVYHNPSINKRDCIQSYSKKFRYACDTIGLKKYFHCLRDTYAVRRYLQTGDLYLVAKELGHSTVKMTEKYANFDLRLLKQDFPSILADQKQYDKTNYHTESYTNHCTQIKSFNSNIVGNV